MNRVPFRILCGLALITLMPTAWMSSSFADCNCRSGGVVMSAPVPDMMFSRPVMPAPVAPPQRFVPNPRFGADISPPPGTLGRTYQIPSRPISLDDHPRTAKMEISGASNYDLVIVGVEKFKGELGPDGVWRFESDRPLVPGMPHVYEVIAVEADEYNRRVPVQVRKFRLIPGRVIFVDY